MTESIECPKCKGLGWIETKTGVIKCDCVYRDITTNIFQRMNIPKRYRDKDFSNFQIINDYYKSVVKRINEYILSDDIFNGKGLFFYGNPGVGKTHLAVATLKEIFRKRKIVGLFYDTRALLFDLKATFDGSSSGREILDDVVKTPVLVLDDLGSERLSDWARDILHYIIVKRYNEMLPIIITSNINISGKGDTVFEETLEERMGSSIASRITEVCKKIEIKGEDYRKSTLNILESLSKSKLEKLKGVKNEKGRGKKGNKGNSNRGKN